MAFDGFLRAYSSLQGVFSTQNTRKLSLILRIDTAASSNDCEMAPPPALIRESIDQEILSRIVQVAVHVVHTPEVGFADTNGNEAAAHVHNAEKNTQLKKKRSLVVVQCV